MPWKVSNVLLAAAPGEGHTGALSMRCADSLGGLAFAVQADHLMRSGGQTPTGEQLASADSALARRARPELERRARRPQAGDRTERALIPAP